MEYDGSTHPSGGCRLGSTPSTPTKRKMFYLYILKSQKNGSYYIGSCKDINKRLNLHNKSLVKSTKRYIPWTLIYSEEYNTLSEARKREIQIKSWKKRKSIENLLNH